MKLSAIVILTLLALLVLPGAPRADAQQAPASVVPGQAQPQDAQAQPEAQPADPAAPAAQAPPLTAEERRALTVEVVQDQRGLPAQIDTGFASPEGLWMPQSASTAAPDTDGVFWFITWVTIFFTILILGLMFFFAWYYRRRSDDEPDPVGVSTHSTTLELTWTVIPSCIVLIMFTLGFKDYLAQTVAPPNALRVDVIGRMWSWGFTYPSGAITSELHLPQGRPVRFVLSSEDVIHSLFIPAFRLKKDVVPGRFNEFWVEPTAEGIFEVFCAEYCGTNHSRMISKAFVYPLDVYDQTLEWISDIYRDPITGEERPPHEVGAALWATRGCQGCHTVDGSGGRPGPTWRNLYMAERRFTDGTTGIADDDYIRESIFRPAARIVIPFGATMPSYAGQLSETDVRAIIAYIRTLSDEAGQLQGGERVPPEASQSLGNE